MNKEVKELVRSISHVEGVDLRNSGSGHFAVYKDGRFVATIARTPSTPHWRDNAMRDLRKAGILPPAQAKGPWKRPDDLLPVEKLRQRIKALPNRAEFARFLFFEMPKLHPQMKTYGTYNATEVRLGQLARRESGLSNWSHVLIDQAFREWDAIKQAEANGAPVATEPEPVITDEELDEAIAIDRGEAELEEEPTESNEAEPSEQKDGKLAEMRMTELARDHEELTERIANLAERVASLTNQLDGLIGQRDAVATEILSRLSESEGRP